MNSFYSSNPQSDDESKLQFEPETIIFIGHVLKGKVLKADDKKNMKLTFGENGMVPLCGIISNFEAKNIEHKLSGCVNIF